MRMVTVLIASMFIVVGFITLNILRQSFPGNAADGRINLRGLSASVIGKQFLAYSALDSLNDPNKVC